MRAAVTPEKSPDVGNRLFAGNQVEGPVVDAQHGRAHKRSPGQVGQLDQQVRPAAREQFGRLGGDLAVQYPLLGWNKHLPHNRVDLPLRNGERLDKEVRQVTRNDLDFLDGALALHPDEPRWRTEAIRGPHKQQHRRVRAIGVDH
ncbi:MAG: hypothetical protein ACKOJF_02490, partial [Planctomycetaceae bacterium]